MGSFNKTLSAGAVVIVAIFAFQFFSFRLINLCDLHKAPFIYGFEACEILFSQVANSRGTLDPLSALGTLFTSKVNLHSSFNNSKVLFKSLSTSSSLRAFDAYTNDYLLEYPGGISPDNIVDDVSQHLNANEPKNLYICPGNASIISFLAALEKTKSSPMSDLQWFSSLWTLLKLNPEPAILMLLEPPKWPVPKYHGSCGRLAIVEDCGPDLSNYRDASLQIRTKMALQIIDMMLKFTKNHTEFSFYLTDVSLDNFAFGQSELVKFVDFENVIVVHRNISVFKTSLHEHVTEHQECHNCFAFSPQDVCSHPYSDHNIYAICKEIFSNLNTWKAGFLHDHPNKKLNKLVDQCVKGNDVSRFATIEKIRDILASFP